MARRITAANAGPLVDSGLAVVVGDKVFMDWNPVREDGERARFGLNYGECRHCGTSLIGHRADATTCSNACRQADYRRRR